MHGSAEGSGLRDSSLETQAGPWQNLLQEDRTAGFFDRETLGEPLTGLSPQKSRGNRELGAL